jgi:hypothetical protein
MGLWSAIKGAAHDANEQAHGERLEKDWQATMAIVESLPEDLRVDAMVRIRALWAALAEERRNWTQDGALQMCRKLYAAARDKQHVDRKESVAIALAAIWLESDCRVHPKASLVHEHLESLAMELNAIDIPTEAPPMSGRRSDAAERSASSPSVWAHATWDEWLLEFKRSAGRANPQLAPDHDGASLVDFMDHAPLRRAHEDGIDPSELGREFASQFDLSSFGR